MNQKKASGKNLIKGIAKFTPPNSFIWQELKSMSGKNNKRGTVSDISWENNLIYTNSYVSFRPEEVPIYRSPNWNQVLKMSP